MYRVLVVDDEPRHRRGLINMLNELRPEYEIYEAKNGEQALEIVKASNIEIVLTDIRMPVMDGLQFVEKLGEQIRFVKVIIISAYNYFEYAQRAIKSGAFDYILKPVDATKITDVLMRAEQKLQSEKKEKNSSENVRNLLAKSLPVYLEHRMNKWICGMLNNNEAKEIENMFFEGRRKIIIVTEIKRTEFEAIYMNREEAEEIKNNIKDWIAEILNPIGKAVSFYLETYNNRMATIIEYYNEITHDQKTLCDLLMEFIKRIESEYGLHSLIGVGSLFHIMNGNEQLSYEEAYKALENKFHLGWGRVLVAFENREEVLSNSEERKVKKNKEIIIACMKYIEEHFMEELTLDNISEKFYFNPSYFSSIFKSCTGVNVTDYLLSVRVGKSKEILRKHDYKVYEVAARVGYKDVKYFNRIFKKEVGVTPEEYRRNLYKKETPIND